VNEAEGGSSGPQVVNILRRISTLRLLLLCGILVAAGASITAIASAVGSGPVPPAKPLAQAVHDALAAPHVEGVTARVQLTDHLLEGANLAGGSDGAGELSSSPLISGGSGRMWISGDGRVRLELQAEKGDTQIVYDGTTLSMYDASKNTLYRYTPKHQDGEAGTSGGAGSSATETHEPPSVAKIEEAIAKIDEHAQLSGATPTDVAGQPAYTVRLAPKEAGSLIGGAELSFDADHGVPLRAAVYSTTSASPVIELAASEISYGPVEASVFDFTPPADAKVEDIAPAEGTSGSSASPDTSTKPKLTTHGHGPSTVAVLESSSGKEGTSAVEGLPQVDINGTSASELRTALGTVLSFERSGVHYLVAGAVTPAAVEEVARGL
jgi:outer membrane lipoprotein-sorting protein